MQNQKKQIAKIHKTHGELLMSLQPLYEHHCLLEAKFVLDKMFTEAMKNAPENEIDNWSAQQLSPVYLSLSHTLLLLYKNEEIQKLNIEYNLETDTFY